MNFSPSIKDRFFFFILLNEYTSLKIIVDDLIGEKSVLHKHDLNYAFYVLQGSSLEVRDVNDDLLATIDINAGETLSFNIDGDDLVDKTGIYRINRTHSAKNVGDSVFREVLIEKKVLAIAK